MKVPSWECEVRHLDFEIEIPQPLVEPVLRLAAEQKRSVDDIVATAIKNYLEGDEGHAV